MLGSRGTPLINPVDDAGSDFGFESSATVSTARAFTTADDIAEEEQKYSAQQAASKNDPSIETYRLFFLIFFTGLAMTSIGFVFLVLVSQCALNVMPPEDDIAGNFLGCSSGAPSGNGTSTKPATDQPQHYEDAKATLAMASFAIVGTLFAGAAVMIAKASNTPKR